MNKRIKKIWVGELRSGKYRQGKGALQTQDGRFCCLGVLCDIYAKTKEGIQRESYWKKSKNLCPYFVTGKQEESKFLPQVILKWAGLTSVSPLVGDISLGVLNDSPEVGFNIVANRIEKYL